MSEQLTEHERKAFIKIFKAIDGFFTFAPVCAETLPAKAKMTRENSIFFIVLNS